MLIDPFLLRSDLLSHLILTLPKASSTVEILSRVGRALKHHLALERVWIGHPATVDSSRVRCYWIFEIPPGEDLEANSRFTSELRLIRQEILHQLQHSPDHLLWVASGHPPIWQDPSTLPVGEQGLSPLEELIGTTGIQAFQTLATGQSASLPANVSSWLDSPQLLAGCYPQGDPPWLLGLATDRDQVSSLEVRAQIQVVLQLTTLALERQGFLRRAQQSEQKQRSTANRWMDRFRVATESTRQVIYEWDIDTEAMEWTSSLRAIFGHPPMDKVETRRWWTAQIHPDDRQRVIRQVSQCLDELQVFLCEYRWQRADGYYAWVRDYGRIFCGPQGYAVRMIGSLEDISARRRTTKLLQRLRQELRTTMALSPVPLLIVGTDLQIVEVNPALEEVLGYDRDTLHQMTLARMVHPADLDADLRERRQMFEGQIGSYVTEKRLIRVEGSEFAAQITVSMLGDGVMDREMIWQIRAR